MKLKEIFIRGFKSFLGPIRLDLSFRIVAIVGPNGCGKSNVIDAVRWCLGEQNSRTLRGLKMEDVIFNGAGEIKPLGMAEVKLLLEECNDQTVPEHLRRAEIEITRRLYRTGESEYLINNTPCRLKDIQELFMGTGLGQRAYSIIGQGAIGAIVDYRPEQLRDLLHEAVDITRYQKQMELAQRRISEAKENLLRVRDLIVEVEKGVNLLRRQAERAKKYKKLTEEIQNLELTLLCNEFALLNKGLQEVNSYCSSLYTQEASIRKEITNQEGLLQEFELQIEEGDVALKKLRKIYGDLKHNYESKKSTLENKRNELSLIQNRNCELTNEMNELLGKKEKLEFEISSKHKQVNDLQVHIDETKERRAEYEKRIQDEEQKLKRTREEYKVLNEQFINLQKQKHSIQRDLEFLYKTKNEIEKRRRELEEEKEGLQSHIKELNENWRLKAKEKRSYEERLMGLEVEKRSLGQEIQDMVSLLAQLEGRERALEKELTETKLKIKAIKEFLEGYVGMRGGTRFLLQKKEALNIEEDGIKGLLLDL
ncbi:MAG: AAA family ATPase, partial [Desulfatiglandales bacterium]